MLPNLNYTRIRSFLECGRCLNLSQAAKNMFITQPSLSRQIAALENDLGVTLFLRSKTGLQFTPAGKVMFAEFSNIDSSIEDAWARVQRISERFEFKLTIACFEAMDIGVKTEECIRRFGRQYGSSELIFLRCGIDKMILMFADGTLDVAIGHSFVMDRLPFEVESMPLVTGKMCLAVPIGSQLRSIEDITPEKLREWPFIMLNDRHALQERKSLEESCVMAGFTPIIRVVPNMESVYDCVSLGLGVAIVDHAILRSKGDTVRLFPTKDTFLRDDGDEPVARCVWLRSNSSPGLHQFVEMLRFDGLS